MYYLARMKYQFFKCIEDRRFPMEQSMSNFLENMFYFKPSGNFFLSAVRAVLSGYFSSAVFAGFHIIKYNMFFKEGKVIILAANSDDCEL